AAGVLERRRHRGRANVRASVIGRRPPHRRHARSRQDAAVGPADARYRHHRFRRNDHGLRRPRTAASAGRGTGLRSRTVAAARAGRRADRIRRRGRPRAGSARCRRAGSPQRHRPAHRRRPSRRRGSTRGLMQPTKIRTLLLAGLVGAVGGWAFYRVWESAGHELPQLTYYAIIGMVVLGGILLASGWPIRRWVRGDRERPIDPLRAARVLVLSKAASTA